MLVLLKARIVGVLLEGLSGSYRRECVDLIVGQDCVGLTGWTLWVLLEGLRKS